MPTYARGAARPGGLGGAAAGLFHSTAQTTPWDALSDAELAAVTGTYDNTVMIRFKEADAESGVDGQGRSITSEETVERMSAPGPGGRVPLAVL